MRAEAVQVARDQLLARAALAEHEDRARDRGEPRDRLAEPHDRRARAGERRVGPELPAERGDLGVEPAPLERLLDLAHHAHHRLRLVDEPRGAEPHRLDAAVVAAGAGVDDHRRVVPLVRESPEHLEAVEPGHLEVEDDAVHRLAREELECLGAAARDRRVVPAEAAEIVGVLLGHRRDVIHYQQVRHAWLRANVGLRDHHGGTENTENNARRKTF